jgi:hypothetical protein
MEIDGSGRRKCDEGRRRGSGGRRRVDFFSFFPTHSI